MYDWTIQILRDFASLKEVGQVKWTFKNIEKEKLLKINFTLALINAFTGKTWTEALITEKLLQS